MKNFQLALLTICVIGTALARPEGESGDPPPPPGGDHAKWHEKHKKHIQCAIETQNLTACCPLPKYDELENDAECKVHLEGIETKDNKQKGKAGVCFLECIFKKNELIEGKEVKWDKIRELNGKMLGSDLDFKDVSAKAIDFCEAKVNSWINATLELLKRPLIIIQPVIYLVPINVTFINHNNTINGNQNLTQNYLAILTHQGKEAKEKFKNFKGGPNKHHQHHNKDGQKRCNIIPTMITGCIQGYIVRSCPESKWTGTDECNTLKSKAKTIEECTSH